jgi:dipeptidyl aminopeptidase/acylaminoacyl peptidase
MEDYNIVGYGEGNTLLVLSEHEGWTALYEFDLAANKIAKKIFGGEKVELEGIAHLATSDDLAGVLQLTDYPSIKWFDPVFADMQAKIDKAVAPRKADIVDWSTDKTRLLVAVGADRGRGTLYYFNTADGVMQKLFSDDDPLKGIRLAETAPVHYTARDGLENPAYLTLPVGRAAEKLPLIVMPHGGPEVRDHLGYDDWTQFLANRGYAVLRPNYRGSSGLGKAFREKGAGQYGLGMQDDVTDGVRWAITKGIADPRRVCIMGGSYGGYAALWGPIRDPDLYRCAISFAGIADVPAMRRYDREYLNPKRSRELYARLAQPDLNAISPAKHFEALKAPTLIAHGKKDQRVPYTQSRDYAAQLRKAGKSVEYLELPEANHFLSREADRIAFLEAVDSFLAKHNPAD